MCPSVGQLPLLVLSYKNHAVDEFLLDLLKTARLGLPEIGEVGRGVQRTAACSLFGEKSNEALFKWAFLS